MRNFWKWIKPRLGRKTLGRKFSDQHWFSESHLTLDPQDAFLKKSIPLVSDALYTGIIPRYFCNKDTYWIF